MTIRLISLFLAAFMLAGAAQPGRLVREGQKIEWAMQDGRKAYRLGDLTATYDRVQCAPLGEDCEDGDVEPVLTIARADGASVKIAGSPSHNVLMLGRLRAGGPVVAFVQSYSGGMHCCYAMQVVVPDGAGLKIVDLGAFDGSEIGWPRDVDGDGMRDFVVGDDRFLYAFGSYASSVPPPVVLNVVDGERRDASGEARFAPVFAKAAAEARKMCVKEAFPNGACAAWAASAARLGQLDAVWPTILAEYSREAAAWPEGCKVERGEADGECPEDQLIEYPDYPTGLRAFLAHTGYIAAP